MSSLMRQIREFSASIPNAVDPRRRVPVLIEPEDLDVDIFAGTHNHPDHTDPDTIRRLRTGGPDYSELLLAAPAHSPDLMITCINGGFNNLSHWEAADLAGKIKPRAAIPCHYDMFADNSCDPKQFRASLKLREPEVRYQELEYATPLIFSAER